MAVFLLFQLCLLSERRMLRSELRAEAREQETLPEAHVVPLSSWRRRVATRFVPAGVDQDTYTKTAMTLAFRRIQSRRARGRRQLRCARDLERLRRELRGLLTVGPAAG